MNHHENPAQTVAEIRSMMERSSRFISLSGLSGVVAGLAALIGAWVAYQRIGLDFVADGWRVRGRQYDMEMFADLLLIALAVLAVAVGFGLFFTIRNSRRKGQKIWDSTARRLLLNLMLPLSVGGIFCLLLILRAYFELVAPATLVFYGLALVNASKYTLHDIRWLGVSEIVLGLIGMAMPGYGLLLWAFGFGVLHVAYGTAMWWKYEFTN